MTSRLSTKLFAIARVIGRRAMIALSKNGKEVILNEVITAVEVMTYNRRHFI